MKQPALSWYQEMVIYGLDVSLFRDSNGDGTGDFAGVTQSLDYLQWLGIDALWILPCFPSGARDNGYDIVDHFSIDPANGTMQDFLTFLDAARQHDLRVILDLVVNHTSDQHLWFREACTSRESPYHNYYVWTDDPDNEPEYSEVFPGVQHGTWNYVPDVDRYYLHRFYPYQPELNTTEPAVQEAIHRIVEFWLRLGVDGFRIDAAPYLGDDTEGDVVNPHGLLRDLRKRTDQVNPDAVLIAEADLPSPDLEPYFGKGDECQLIFSFVINQALFIALVDEAAEPLLRAIRRMPEPPAGCGWLGYLRNLDELTLSRLHADQKERVMAAFAPDPDMQIYGRGIRRRLAPMLDGNPEWLKMTCSLVFSLPFPAMLMYGDEIGLGEDLDLPERFAVRLPMQWNGHEPNAGFSDASPDALVRAIPASGPFSPHHVNVEDQLQDAHSLLRWNREVIHTRRRFRHAFSGKWSHVDVDHPAVLVQLAAAPDQVVLTAHNLAKQEATVTMPLPEGKPLEPVLSQPASCRVNRDHGILTLHLPGHGCCWLAWNGTETAGGDDSS